MEACMQVDQSAFRTALGAFATGVTVVTTCDAHGMPVGVTASSFNSVSLDPPMVLWSLGRDSRSIETFTRTDRFAVHILAAGQETLSNNFASSKDDKFGAVSYELSSNGTPHLGACAARFDCRTAHRYDGGDHVILVGEVVDFEVTKEEPLLFHRGAYTTVQAAD
jgi:3-hydroxy-9,10-secoandrosta-1,3,5(10)-triene-9,17-dione monooxygenase reductase component